MLPIRTNLPANVLRVMVNRLDGHDPKKVLANIDLVTENVYGKLPSGDYGRGDVRRAIETWADTAEILELDGWKPGVSEYTNGGGPISARGYLVLGTPIKTKEDK